MTKDPAPNPSLSRVLAKNTILNLSTHGLLFVLALLTIPILVGELKEDAFGLLTLVWTLIGYFSLLDFGVSRAITKFLSQSLAEQKEDEMRAVGATALAATVAIGAVTGITVFVLSPFLATDVFGLSVEWTDTGIDVFRIAAIGLPMVLLFGTSKGILMAGQRFDMVNGLQLTSGVGQMGAAVVLALSGNGITEIVVATVAVRFVVMAASLIVVRHIFPGMVTRAYAFDVSVIRKLLVFGGWVTVSQIVSPLFLYLDRVFIGAFLSLAAVTYYSIPQEGMARILVLPLSLTSTLFPALSQESGPGGDVNRWESLYARSVKYLVLAGLPLFLVLFAFAGDILHLWVGADIAGRSSGVLRILSIGLFFNIVAQVPMTALLAVGRPDIPAKFHLIELPLMILCNVLLIPWLGITGAAIVWGGRVTVDALLLFGAVSKVRRRSVLDPRLKSLGRILFIHAGIIVLAVTVLEFLSDPVARGSVMAIVVIAYCFGVWLIGLDTSERKFLHQIGRLRIP